LNLVSILVSIYVRTGLHVINFQMLHTVTHVHGNYVYFLIPRFSFYMFTDNIWMAHRLNPSSPGVHPVSCRIGIGFLSKGVKRPGCSTDYPTHLVPRSKKE